jgi:BirA family transcriptional regulator, biotin operon repressor / biotin---[acetyl-CoA-carboxylase] ligase
MTQTLRIVQELSAAQFRSGEAIATRLSVSRATVHNALREVRALGLEIHSVTGRGYRLAEPLVWLDAEAVQAAVAGQGFAVGVAGQVDSTNAVLLREAKAGAAHKQVLAAEWQSAGRGRRGRQWQAMPGGAVLFSLLWRFNQPVAALSGLSLAVGLALVRALRGLGLTEVMMKWPNDILWRGRKLAGLLIELEGDMLSPASAVIGIGLNVRLPESLRTAIDQPVVDLVTAGLAVDRNHLLATLLTTLDATLTAFEQGGFASLQAEWQAAHAYHGQAVQVQRGDETLHGIVCGVDGHGALLLDTAQGRMTLHSGEVSVRRVG